MIDRCLMKNRNSILIKSTGVAVCAVCLISCGPVNRFTKVKRVPREYALNYCAGEIKAPRSTEWFKREPWIVFSDKSGNMSFQSATGKNEMKEIKYMDAFLVIKRKGDWLKVIEYDPSILVNGQLKEWRKAKYSGWIHKGDLLLTRSSVTDLATGFKNKSIVILTDTMTLEQPPRYLVADSARLFKDTDLTKEQGKVSLYSIVYPLKKSLSGEQTLVSKRGYISADSVNNDVLGWIDNSLLASAGQQLHVDVSTLPDSVLWFKDRQRRDTLSLRNNQLDESLIFSASNKAMAYSPVLSYRQNKDSVCFVTCVPMPLIDKRDSYVLNVNGNPIFYSDFKEIEQSLKKINVVFVLEGKDETIRRFPSIVNVVQGLRPTLTDDEFFSFRFGAVLTFNEENGEQGPICPLTADYMKMLDFLSVKSKKAKDLRPLYGLRGSWSGLRNAVDMFNDCPDQTNLLIVIGDKGFNSEWADSTLVNQMAKNNCRMLGFQLYGGEPDNFNNFVLQVGNMIDGYAPKVSEMKREKIVYADQLRTSNEYRETKKKNAYCLDFPERSMTQGWLVFPQKNETLELEGLSSAVDSMIGQVKYDNQLLTGSLYRAFDEVGYFRYKLDSTLVDYQRMRAIDARPLVAAMRNASAEWSLPSQPVLFHDSISSELDYYLLTTEDELKSLRKYVDGLSANEVDYKYDAKKSKRKERKFCDCPGDMLYMNMESITPADSNEMHEYASTRKIRRKLVAHYLKYRNYGKYCPIKRKTFLRMPIAEAQRRFTSCPTDNPFLEMFCVKDLKKKKLIPDETLDFLIEYFKSKKKALDKEVGKSFQSNGVTYYWIDRRILP